MWLVYDMICLIDGTYVHECTQDEELFNEHDHK